MVQFKFWVLNVFPFLLGNPTELHLQWHAGNLNQISSSTTMTRFKEGWSINTGVLSFASGYLMKLNPPLPAANPKLWEQKGDLEF